MTSEEISKKLHHNADFIALKRFDYSLKKLLARFPEGAPDRTIAQALNLTEEDVERIYQDLVVRLRDVLKVDVG